MDGMGRGERGEGERGRKRKDTGREGGRVCGRMRPGEAARGGGGERGAGYRVSMTKAPVTT
eukprot:2260379-Rhodomonas_salina.1